MAPQQASDSKPMRKVVLLLSRDLGLAARLCRQNLTKNYPFTLEADIVLRSKPPAAKAHGDVYLFLKLIEKSDYKRG